MATINIKGLRKFAEQAIRVERVLDKGRVSGNAGKVIYLLTAANKCWGVSQQSIVTEGSMSKHTVSKVVGSLVAAGYLEQERDRSNRRAKTLVTTDLGKELLSRLTTALQPERSEQESPKERPDNGPLLFNMDEVHF